ncbi:MAG: M23 family peptidase, partial [Cyanobacteria bacterium J06560_2]
MAKTYSGMRLARLVGAWTIGVLAADVFGQAAYAYEVTLTPSAPRLGDTVSVVVQAETAEGGETAPTVSANGVNYQSFPIGNEQFQALIPTSPLDSPGRITVQVSGVEDTRNMLLNLSDRSFRTQRIWLPPGDNELGTDMEFDRVALF